MSSSSILDLEAISGISGSISIVCWFVVFSPQIIKNWRRGSAEGLSAAFVVIWLVGDVFNIIGAVCQGVLPTMLILALYYAAADAALLCQVLWYNGLPTFGKGKKGVVDEHGEVQEVSAGGDDAERQPLLRESERGVGAVLPDHERHPSSSGVKPFSIASDEACLPSATSHTKLEGSDGVPSVKTTGKTQFTLFGVLFNAAAIVAVCVVGVFIWWLTSISSSKHDTEDLRGELPKFNTIGQVFGYLCAALYLSSRIPQLLLNFRRKSTEGISMLFFLFICTGNLTYVSSILAFNPAPRCANGPEGCMSGEQKMIYLRYIAVNASWIVGSLGTITLDMIVFVQFFLYMKNERQVESASAAEEG